ncbi:MAG TPA: hypothetical protein VN397_01565 [Candidatus Methylomirabilis sp.]|nr:hypothetical protein [Candidatus Methylomirabilis sp.]
MKRHPSPMLLLFAALVALGAGCGAQPATPLQPSAAEPAAPGQPDEMVFTVDPCALITADDAKQILGGTVSPAFTDQSVDFGSRHCRYTTTRESELSRIIEFTVHESDNLKKSLYELPANEYFARLKTAHFASNPEETGQLSGIGDDAYWDGSMIRVLRGNYLLNLSARGFGSGGEDTDQKNREATLKAIKLVLERLK